MNRINVKEWENLRDDYYGLCIDCFEEKPGVEPDAEEYHCEYCGEHSVMGAETLIMVYPELIDFGEVEYDECELDFQRDAFLMGWE